MFSPLDVSANNTLGLVGLPCSLVRYPLIEKIAALQTVRTVLLVQNDTIYCSSIYGAREHVNLLLVCVLTRWLLMLIPQQFVGQFRRKRLLIALVIATLVLILTLTFRYIEEKSRIEQQSLNFARFSVTDTCPECAG
ncbi:hypothetical protein CRX72_19725 [Pantoea sp. BRM17]|nr:hypothetical protein CRX72_19725 [Pantoea sp. BRM17]